MLKAIPKRDKLFYSYEDLPQSLQKKVHAEFVQSVCYTMYDEDKALKEFSQIMDINVSYDFNSDYVNFLKIRFTGSNDYDQIDNMTGIRLQTYIYNNYYKYITAPETKWKGNKRYTSRIKRCFDSCHMTGLYIDYDLLKPIEEFLKSPDDITFLDLMEQCAKSWIKSCQEDMKWQESEEFMIEQFNHIGIVFDKDCKKYCIDDLQEEYDLQEIAF